MIVIGESSAAKAPIALNKTYFSGALSENILALISPKLHRSIHLRNEQIVITVIIEISPEQHDNLRDGIHRDSKIRKL